MDSEAARSLADVQAGIEGGNLRRGCGGFDSEIFCGAIVGSKLAHKNSQAVNCGGWFFWTITNAR